MKGLLRVNHQSNDFLMERSKRLKSLIIDYLNGKQIDHTTKLPKETLTAIIEGNTSLLDQVVTPASINTCFDIEDPYVISYLALSIENNSFSSLQYFAEKGADLELACFDKTPLMYAVKYGHLNMVTYLLEKGADIDKVSVEGKTAMDYAIKYKHPKIEKYLKEYKK